MFAETREESRRFFLACWRKHEAAIALTPLEALVVQVIGSHPEYLAAVRSGGLDGARHQPAHNPFLHMGLHLALIEQVQTDRPPGIRALYHRLVALSGDVHVMEHRIMHILGEVLAEAQARHAMPDEREYLERLARLERAARS